MLNIKEAEPEGWVVKYRFCQISVLLIELIDI